MKAFFAKYKKLVIAILVVLLLIALGVGVAVVLHMRGKTQEKEEKTDFVDMVADLVNEPASPFDEPYEPAETDKKTAPIQIRVNKTRNCLTVYEKDKEGKFTKPVKAMICSVGYNTPLGEFETSDRYTWKIVNGDVWSQYATRITGNVLFHSVTYAEKNKSTLIAKYYNQLGTNASAGCIRLMVSDAKWLMEHCSEGTVVEIYEDKDPGPLGRPASLVVAETEGWDPSDPDAANPWKSHHAALQGAVNRTVERNIPVDYLEGLTATDTVGNNVNELVKVETDMDLSKIGSYKVKYTLVDGIGSTASAEVVYTVADTMPPSFSGIKKFVQVAEGDTISEDKLLEKVFVIDNNEILSRDRINIQMPDWMNLDNAQIVYTIKDDYGNVATATSQVIVDREPPQILIYSDMSSVLAPDQIVDEAYALSRVYATDAGQELPHDWIHVTIYNIDWGYTFVYSVTDRSGQTTTRTDSVSYPIYTLGNAGPLMVTDLSTEQLLQGITLTDNTGAAHSPEGVKVEVKQMNGGQYLVTYQYEYSCVLGNRTATTSRNVTLAGATPEPTKSPSATNAPGTTPTQAPIQAPTHTPENDHHDEDTE